MFTALHGHAFVARALLRHGGALWIQDFYKQVSELSLNGRSFVNLLFLELGAVQTGGEQSTYRYAAGDAISIGGGISASNAYTLDGTMITDTGYATPAFDISIDAIQEFKEQTKTTAPNMASEPTRST